MEKYKIIWTNQARKSLKYIYDYYKEKSPQGAKNVKTDIFNSSKTIYFSKQFQIDDINPNYRRIIVRDFKILYREEKNIIYIIDIISSRQSPNVLKNK